MLDIIRYAKLNSESFSIQSRTNDRRCKSREKELAILTLSIDFANHLEEQGR